jgi:endonuclease/exonuclease/phosphatase family metal-dependent hydrolase
MENVVVASFNVHGGVDGFGRPFDVVAACREIDADVLILQETWSPTGGEPLARLVGDALGYEVDELAMTGARVSTVPDSVGPSSWGPVLVARGPWGLRVGDDREGRAVFSEKSRFTEKSGFSNTKQRREACGVVDQGTWGIALLSRVPLVARSTLDLGQLRRDPARRGAIAVEVETGGHRLRIIGTHLSHLSHGSVLQLRALERMISAPGSPAVLMGDMNMWGPPLSALLPGWRRVVRGRTWPAWRPLAQLDHILVSGGATIVGRGQVLAVRGSDHLPVRARVSAG